MKTFLENLICLIADHPMQIYFVNTVMLGSLLISILLLIRVGARRLPRTGMYVLWIVLGLRLLVPVNLFQFLPEGIQNGVMAVSQEIRVQNMAERLWQEELEELGGRENGYKLSQGESAFSMERTAEKTIEVVSVIWGLGVIFLVVYMLESMLWVRLRFRDAKLVDEQVYTHPLVNNSFVVGWSHPRIYLSERIEEEERRYILCHEMIHIRRHDHVIKPLMFLLCSIFWINPFMWIAYRYMVEDMEISCDEAVLQKFGEHKKKHYSLLLLQMSAVNSGYRRQYAAFCSGETKKRIGHILQYREPKRLLSILLAFVTFCMAGSIMSMPGVDAIACPPAIDKMVYVEQSYAYPEEEGLELADEPAESRKGTLYVEDGVLYTCLLKQGEPCGAARHCGEKWIEEKDIAPRLWEQMQEKEPAVVCEEVMQYIGEGEEFYVMLHKEGGVPRELIVFSQRNNREEYRIPLEKYIRILDTDTTLCKFQAGVTEDQIYFVSDQGIFETSYGTKKIEKVVSATADNVYYLSDDKSEYCDIVRGGYKDYYVAVRRGEKHIICHYGIRKARVMKG